MKAKDTETFQPVAFIEVFGISWISYILPLNPVFADNEVVLKYKLKREYYPTNV